ncbi:MAG: hypothetical protein V3T72_11165 [Thermoanaerobaculia bacterium]
MPTLSARRLRDFIAGQEPARWLSWLGWALFAAAAAISILDVDSGPANPLVHPEALYPAALFQDLGQWATWNTPFSPYFFPDLPLFFFAMWLTGDAVSSLYVFAILQVALLIFGLRWLFRCILFSDEAARRLAGRLVVITGAGLMLTLGLDFAGGKLFLPLFLSAFHTGALVTATFGHAMLIRLLGGHRQVAKTRLLTVSLLVITFLGVLSDQLFFVLFVLPAGAAILFQAWTGKPQPARAVAVATILAGALLAVAAVAWINATGTLHIPSLTPVSLAQVAETLSELPRLVDGVLVFVIDRFFESARAAYRWFWFLWVVVTLLLIFASRRWLARLPGFRHLRRLSTASRRNLAFFAVFTTFCGIATILATVYVAVGQYGVKTGVYGILFVHRYLTSVFVLPVVCLALYAPALMTRRQARVLESALLMLLFSAGAFRASDPDLGSPFPRYRHPGAACLDEAAARHGSRLGLAFSFQAPLVNALSKSGLHADQLTRDFEPTTWIDNRIRAGDTAGYGFVITDSLRPGAVIERAGPPTSEVQCDGWQVFFYDEPIRIILDRR